MVNGCDVLILDPAEQIETLMNHYGLPMSSLKAVMLTDSANLNWFECMMKQPKVRLITEEKIYQ